MGVASLPHSRPPEHRHFTLYYKQAKLPKHLQHSVCIQCRFAFKKQTVEYYQQTCIMNSEMKKIILISYLILFVKTRF